MDTKKAGARPASFSLDDGLVWSASGCHRPGLVQLTAIGLFLPRLDRRRVLAIFPSEAANTKFAEPACPIHRWQPAPDDMHRPGAAVAIGDDLVRHAVTLHAVTCVDFIENLNGFGAIP